MKFKVGDKVSFIDDKGGGVVTKIVDENIVHVEIEDGFEIPTAVSDLVLTSPAIKPESKQEEGMTGFQEDDVHQIDDYISPLYLNTDDQNLKDEGIYFAIVPENQENPLAGNLLLYLLNHSGYQVLYSVFTNDSGVFYGFDFGYLEPGTKVYLDTIERTKIELWVNALVQAVFFKENKTTVLKPISQLLNFKPVKTYKEDAFKDENMLKSKALMVEVGLIKSQAVNPYSSRHVSEENKEVLKEKITSEHEQIGKKPEKESKSFLDKHKIDEKIAEVDLHINNLVEDFTNLQNNDLINIQVDYFKKCLEQAGKDKLYKIIFIHGIGTGVLKNEIIKHLEKTEGIQYYDASFNRYGMGATEVLFYRNK